MKRITSCLLLLCALSLPVIAGDIQMPGICEGPTCPPPPCTENCGSGLASTLGTALTNVALTIITFR